MLFLFLPSGEEPTIPSTSTTGFYGNPAAMLLIFGF
jgi:hypothetical protein